jgi:lipoprotein-anchoring transpeptidase ErfK/SrfK
MKLSRLVTYIIAAATMLLVVQAAAASAADAAQIVRVVAPTVAYTNPGFGDKVLDVPTTTPYGHDQLALRVLASVPGEVDPATGVQRTYYKVHLPFRRFRLDSSAGHVGWIASDHLQIFTSPWAVKINRARRTLTITKNGRRYDSWKVVVGARRTYTPAGRFSVYGVSHRASVDGPYGLLPFAYSTVYAQFGTLGDPRNGGAGNLALHGVSAALSDPMGTAASHGCVRSPNVRAKWLIDHLPIGTPVDVI